MSVHCRLGSQFQQEPIRAVPGFLAGAEMASFVEPNLEIFIIVFLFLIPNSAYENLPLYQLPDSVGLWGGSLFVRL